MSLVIQADPVPLRADEHGAIRVGDTRVTLDLVVEAYRGGATPETIVQWFDSLRLADVHAVIAYYLNHREEVEAYLRTREQQAAEVRAKIEARQQARPGFREELLASRRTSIHEPGGKTMADDQIPVSDSARRKLQDLAGWSGNAAAEELDRAVEEYYHRKFWESVNAGYAELRADPEAWAEEEAERRLWDSTLMDGLDPDERWTEDGRAILPEGGAADG